MCGTTTKTEGEVGAVNMFKPAPSNSLLTVPRRLFCCYLLSGFGVRVSMTFHLTCDHINFIFSLVWVADWPLAANSVDHLFSLYFDYLLVKLFPV